MKKSFLLIGLAVGASFFMPTKSIQAQNSCPNLDFSMANFTNWQAYIGNWNTVFTINTSQPINDRHTIMNAQQLILTNNFYDEYCPHIPKVPAGFAYSAKLGNANAGAEMEALEYTLRVDSNNSLLILHFAFVLQNPGHSITEQPRFTMTLKDSLGRPLGLPCSDVNFPAVSDDPSLACNVTGSSGFVARNWTTVGFSLEALMGRTIKIYFETRDCALGCHFGYAYLAAECRPMKIDLQFCSGQTAARMTAPQGFTYYKWTRSKGQPTNYKEGNAIVARQIVCVDPIDGEIFTCTMTSELGASCNANVKCEIKRTQIDANFYYGVKGAFGVCANCVCIPCNNFKNWYDTCNRTATFVDYTRVYNSTKASILWEIMDPADRSGKGVLWSSSDSLFTHTFPDPDTPTRYRVRLTVEAENGCRDTSQSRPEQHITIFPSSKVKIVGNDQICEGNAAYLVATAIKSKFVRHQWSWFNVPGNPPTLISEDSLEIYGIGTYILTSLDSTGCYARDTLKVVPIRPKFNTLDVWDVSCYGTATGQFIHGPIINGVAPFKLFQWVIGNNTIDGSPSSGAYHNLPADIYYFHAIDANDCQMYGEVEIKQYDSLKISAISYSATCGLDNGRLKLSATGGLPPYKFEIKRYNGTQVALIGGDSAINLDTGTYTIKVTDTLINSTIVDTNSSYAKRLTMYPKANFCAALDTIIVAAQNIPLTSIYVMEGSLTVDINQEATFTVIFNPENACNQNVIWQSLDTTVATVDKNGKVRGISYGETYIVVTSDDGGFQTSRKVMVSNVGINNYELKITNYVIYPNPTIGKLQVTSNELREISTIKIYDIVGKLQKAECRKQNGKIEIDISHLANGLYFLKVDGKVFKIVKQ